MKPDRIKQLLPYVRSKFLGTRTGWVLATCPMVWSHGNNSSDAFAISTDPKKKSRCKCLSCGYSGDLTDLLLDLRHNLTKDPKTGFNLLLASQIVSAEFEEMELSVADIPDFESKPHKTETLFPEQWLKNFRPISFFGEGMDYCLKRGITKDTLKDLDVRFDPMQKRVCFPFRNFNHELMGMQGRSILKQEEGEPEILRYFQYGYHGKRNSHIWMGEDKVSLDSVVIPCEGPFDYAKIWQVYPNVVASFTSGLSRTKVKRIADAEEILTFYDYGSGGNAARESLRKFLPKQLIVDVIPTPEEEDAGAMSTEAIKIKLSEYLDL